MDSIFHEKQEGSLCAQHCLNALLQGPYFTPVDLGTLAQQMDDEERLRMAESGEESEEYRKFLQQPSGNMDDSGYFSVQVICSALSVWGLELVPYTSTEQRARDAYKCPSGMQAYICHYKDHWFTIRKLGIQWFNLNSLLSSPELISDTYLAMFLIQLQQEGYSIFVVFGELPDCEADTLLKIKPVIPSSKVVSISVETERTQEEKDVEKAIKLSLGENSVQHIENDKDDLQKALLFSLQGHLNDEHDSDEEVQLNKAIAMSLENDTDGNLSTSTQRLNDEIRKKRLAYLEKLSQNKNT